MSKDLRRLRQQAEARLLDLDVPRPFGLEELCLRLGGSRGRPIYLRPLSLPDGPSGAWLAAEDSDYIFYERDTAIFHQEHIVLHEVGHILAGHEPADVDVAGISELLTHLDGALVGRVLARTGYSRQAEQEAEVFASIVQQHARASRPSPTTAAAEVVETLVRMETAMGNGQ